MQKLELLDQPTCLFKHSIFLSIMTKAKITFVTDVDAKASASLAKAYSAEDMGKEYFPNKKYLCQI